MLLESMKEVVVELVAHRFEDLAEVADQLEALLDKELVS